MRWEQLEIDPKNNTPQMRARRDLIVIIVLAVIGCVIVLSDPDRAFEWLAGRKAIQFDEFLTAVTVLGVAFAVFSWRRWTDLSRQVGEYKRLQAELSELNEQASLMSETDDLLQSCLSSEEAYKITIRHFEAQFPTLSGAIFTITDIRDSVEIAASWGKPAVNQRVFAIQDCWALRRGRINRSFAADPRLVCAHIGPLIPAYALCVPMMAQGETLGVLYLDISANTEITRGKPLTEAQERVVRTLAEHLALAVANLNLRETLRTEAIRDPLTGLFNRRYMEASLEREFRRSLRRQTSLAVIMIDVDHFKQFNDSHGHEAGDAVLRELAKLFQSQLRAEDIASRYGGEEFILTLPETHVEAAWECAERLRRGVYTMQIPHYGETLEGIRLSIGVACYPQHGATIEALVRAADAALYRAKELGRDQLALAESL